MLHSVYAGVRRPAVELEIVMTSGDCMFSKELTLGGHTRRFVLASLQTEGWELRVEQDSAIVRRTRYTDWHRVERALGTGEREVGQPAGRGWGGAGGQAR